MAFRTAPFRPLRLASSALRAPAPRVRSFHATPAAFVKVGDQLPDVELMESSPGNKVSLAREAQKTRNMIILGVPAAFSPGCSATHIPSFLSHPRTKDFDLVAVVSVNDAFV
jgi:2-Cys peroxiredoxin 5